VHRDDINIARMELDRNGMELLDPSACVELLSTTTFGRVAVTHNALPVILPVAFSFIDNDVVFAVGPGVLARAAKSAQVVGFEADSADETFLNIWSVSVVGQLSTMVDRHDIQRAQQLSLGPWAAACGTFVKLAPRLYSGRRRVTPGV